MSAAKTVRSPGESNRLNVAVACRTGGAGPEKKGVNLSNGSRRVDRELIVPGRTDQHELFDDTALRSPCSIPQIVCVRRVSDCARTPCSPLPADAAVLRRVLWV